MDTKITVITPTIRPEGLHLVNKALKRQTLIDFEWIIISPLTFTLPSECDVFVKEPEKEPGDVWTLNKAYNKALGQAKGDLIVSWQDWTYTEPQTLDKFWYHFTQEPKTVVTAVGNKYADDTWTVETWRDPRMRNDQGSFYPCFFNDIEFNLAGIPRGAFFAVGGFDEELDKWYGMDGYSVVDRLNIIGGYDFKIDQTIKSYSLEHGRVSDWEEKNALHGPYDTRRKDYLANAKLTYLQ